MSGTSLSQYGSPLKIDTINHLCLNQERDDDKPKSNNLMHICIYIPVVPFCLDERSNPKGYVHSFLLNEPNELYQIVVAFEVELHACMHNQKRFTIYESHLDDAFVFINKIVS